MKNKIRWIGNYESAQLETELKIKKKEHHDLIEQEKELDKWINKMQDTLIDLAKDETNGRYSYVTFEDIKSLNPSKDDIDPFLVIRAPKGTAFELPTHEKDENPEYPYQLYLNTVNGEILVYLVSNEKYSIDSEEISKNQ